MCVCVCVCVLSKAESANDGNHSIFGFSYFNIHVIQNPIEGSVTLHKYLSQDESLFYAHMTSGAVWHLILRKISPSQDSYLGHMVTGK